MFQEVIKSMLWSLVLVLTLSSITAIYGESCSQDGAIRLSSTSSVNLSNAGRVEICVNGTWGTIAAESIATPWSEKNAQVACIQLGFSGALNVILQRTIPFIDRPASPIHISAVTCNGTERRIVDCPHESPTEIIDHGHDAYIVCRPNTFRYSVVHPSGPPQSGDIRLFGDVRNGYGAVQIYTVTLGWQGICPDSSWNDSDAATICQDLGYQSGTIATPIDAVLGPGGQVPLRQLYAANCPGRSSDDVSTGVCSFKIQSSPSGNCAFSEGVFAAVQCSSSSETSVRLIGGSHSREGIVEIVYNGRWGMVCNDDFSSTDARVVCQELGFGNDGTTMSLSSSSSILEAESNLKPIWLTEIGCTPSDTDLGGCVREQNVIGIANCRSTSLTVAAVDCGDPPPLTPGQTAGVVIGVLVFLAIAIPLLVICLDENKKKETLAKLRSCRTRLSKVRVPRPRLPKRQSRPQPQPQPQPQPRTQAAAPPAPAPAPAPIPPAPVSGPPFPEPRKLAPQPESPTISKVPSAPPEFSRPPNQGDLPPPYPGGPGPAYPPQFTAHGNYQEYPPPWSSAAYPPPS